VAREDIDVPIYCWGIGVLLAEGDWSEVHEKIVRRKFGRMRDGKLSPSFLFSTQKPPPVSQHNSITLSFSLSLSLSLD